MRPRLLSQVVRRLHSFYRASDVLIPLWAKGAIAAAALAAAGFYGYTKGKAEGDVKVALVAKEKSDMAAEYERKLGERKVEIVTQYVDRWNVIKERETQNVAQATHNVPNQYQLSNGWVYLHDQSARAAEADGARSSDASPSGVGDNQALATVVTNYSRYHQCEAQVKALQDLIVSHNKTIDDLNAKAKK